MGIRVLGGMQLRLAISNFGMVYFWNFLFTISGLCLTSDNETHGK